MRRNKHFKVGDRVLWGSRGAATIVAPVMDEWNGHFWQMVCYSYDHKPKRVWRVVTDDGDDWCQACQHSMRHLTSP